MDSTPLWRNRRYLRFRIARVVSILGSNLSAIAYPLLVLHLGGSPAQAGAIASCSLATITLCRLPGGHLADRIDRRTLMIIADVTRTAVVASIPLAASLGRLTYPQLLFVAAAEGAATAAFGPASTALLRDIVPAERLGRALAHTQGSNGAIYLLGPAVGGLCYGLDPILPFLLDSASYALSAGLLLAGGLARPRPAAATEGKPAGGVVDQRVTAGVRWLWSRPGVMRVVIFAGIINLAAAATPVALIVVLRDRSIAPGAIGAVVACTGAGAIAGSLFSQQIIRRLSPGRLCLAVGVTWAAGFGTIALDPSPWVAGPVLALLFLLSPAAGIMLATVTLSEAPRELLGRVSTAEQMVSTGLAIAGPLLASVVLQTAGPFWMWLTLSACCLLVTAGTAIPLGSSRRDVPTTPAAALRRG